MKHRLLAPLLVVAFFTLAISVGTIASQFGARYATATGSYGATPIHKFGLNPGLAGGDEDIWDCPELSAPVPEEYPFQTTAYTLYASSSDAGDDDVTLLVSGIDGDWDLQLDVPVTLDGQNGQQVGAANDWMCVWRAAVTGGTAVDGDIYFGLDSTPTAGVPDDLTTLQACIRNGRGQTLMATFCTPDNYRTTLEAMRANILPAGGAPAGKYSDLVLWTRASTSPIWRNRYTVGLNSDGGGDHTVWPIPRTIPPRTFVRIMSDSATTTTSVGASFDLLMIAD